MFPSFRPALPRLLLAVALALPFPALAGQFVETDICVFGGTSGGVAAAVTAARLGKSATLVAANNHVGGMSNFAVAPMVT